jgi:myo-inositol-1(or 4)-monophosphatase
MNIEHELTVSKSELSEIAEIALQIGQEAGALAADRPANLELKTKSSAKDLVTQMDTATERLIVERLREHRPLDGVIGEEGTATKPTGEHKVVWVIDPIDGTTNYIYELPIWAVSIGVEIDGVPAVGVVVAPAIGETFFAVKGEGAKLIAQGKSLSLKANQTDSLAEALIVTGFSCQISERGNQADAVMQLLPMSRDIRRLGSAALDLSYVAAGRVDAFYEQGLNHWDYAGGYVIATEAGAKVESLRGGPLFQGTTIAAAEPLFSNLSSILAKTPIP